MSEANGLKVNSLIQALRVVERVALYTLAFLCFAASAFTAMWHGFISESVVMRSLIIALLGTGVSFYLVHTNVLPRRMLSGVILVCAFAILILDLKRELGVTLWQLIVHPHSSIAISVQDAISLLMAFILTLAALKHMQLIDPIDFSLLLLLGLCIYTLMLPVCRTLSFVLFFIPYGILAAGVFSLLQSAHLRFVASMVEIQGWERALYRSLIRTVLSLSGWVLVLAIVISYSLTSFMRPFELLPQLSKIELAISEQLSKYLFKAHSILSFYGFSISLRHPISEFSDTVVIRVECNVPAYWRVSTYDYYKDGSWRRRLKWHTKCLEKGEELILNQTDDRVDDSIQTEQVKQTFHVERCTLAYLPAIFEPVRVDADLEWLSFDSAGTIRSRRLVTPGFSYNVWSRVKIFSMHEVAWKELTREDIARLSHYLQVPAGIELQLKSIARQVTAGATTPWEKAQAIRRYLKRTFIYDEKPPLPPYECDPVIYFLTSSRRGICTHFASAMVLLCRVVGIPARLATGFAMGEWDDARRSFIVRERDAHAWAEVYVPPVGWVPMEATPGYSIPPPRQLGFVAESDSGNWFGSLKEKLLLLWEGHDVAISIALVLLSLLAFSIFVMMHTQIKIPFVGGAKSVRGEAVKLFNRASRIVAKRYRRRKPSETAIEYAMNAKGILPDKAHAAFMHMAELFTESIYSGRRHNASLMRVLLRELKAALRHAEG